MLPAIFIPRIVFHPLDDTRPVSLQHEILGNNDDLKVLREIYSRPIADHGENRVESDFSRANEPFGKKCTGENDQGHSKPGDDEKEGPLLCIRYERRLYSRYKAWHDETSTSSQMKWILHANKAGCVYRIHFCAARGCSRRKVAYCR